MFRTEITIDGDRYFMCIPPLTLMEQIRSWAKERMPENIQRCFQESCVTCREEDEYSFSLFQIQIISMTHLGYVNNNGDIEFSSGHITQLQPILLPLDDDGNPYFLPEKDYPNGSITYGGSVYYHDQAQPTDIPVNITVSHGKLQIGDTNDEKKDRTYAFMAYKGILCCTSPIMMADINDMFRNWDWVLDRGLWKIFQQEVIEYD